MSDHDEFEQMKTPQYWTNQFNELDSWLKVNEHAPASVRQAIQSHMLRCIQNAERCKQTAAVNA